MKLAEELREIYFKNKEKVNESDVLNTFKDILIAAGKEAENGKRILTWNVKDLGTGTALKELLENEGFNTIISSRIETNHLGPKPFKTQYSLLVSW